MPLKSNEVGYIGTRESRPTDLSSKQIKRAWTQKVKDEALFSARTTYKSYLDMVKKKLVDVASGTVNPQVATEQLQDALKNIGYDPARGFPGNKTVPPARPRSIEDLSSSGRIQLILDTNVKRARSMGQMASSDDPVMMAANPAWRLTRMGARKKPRGNWRQRWAAAGAACGWNGAARKQMVALKTSPIWKELGAGSGGFMDTLGSPYPPFAFGSGMAWMNVDANEWRRICAAEGIPDGLAPIKAAAAAEVKKEDGELSADQKDKAREILAKLRKRREDRESSEGAYSTVNPVPLPPYAQKEESVLVKGAKRSFSNSRDVVRRLAGEVGMLYIPLVDKLKAKMKRVADESGVRARREYAEADGCRAFLETAREEADRMAASLDRYQRMMERNSAGAGYGRLKLYVDAAKKVAANAEELEAECKRRVKGVEKALDSLDRRAARAKALDYGRQGDGV